jgi:hypothetical protein
MALTLWNGTQPQTHTCPRLAAIQVCCTPHGQFMQQLPFPCSLAFQAPRIPASLLLASAALLHFGSLPPCLLPACLPAHLPSLPAPALPLPALPACVQPSQQRRARH